ncbi:hypothetical protein N9163_00740 [bacterium]|nr:hypothetical protein [bacterium]
MAENVKIVISALDNTKKAFGGVTNGLKAVAKAAFSMKTALVAAAGVAAVGYLIKQSLTAVDSLKKTADKIGTTTEALSRLQYAAELTGVSVQTVNMASQRFTRRLAEAAKGTGEAKAALQELNINAEELKKKGLDEQMLILSDAFSEVTSSADKVRLAMKLFDSEGVSLVNTLAEGRDGLIAMFREAETLGVVMSARAASGIEDANDALTKLSSLFRGIRDQITGALAPTIVYLTTLIKDKLLEAVTKAGGSIEQFANTFIKNAIVAFGNFVIGISKAIQGIITFANTVAFMVGKVKAYFDETSVAIENTFGFAVSDKIRRAGEQIVFFGENSGFAFGEVNKLASGLENFTAKATWFSEILRDIKLGFKDWSDAIPTTTANIKSLTNQGLNGLTDALTAGVTGAANFADAMKAMAKSVIDSLIKMLIQKYIVDAAFGAITGFIGGQASTNRAGGYGASLGSADPFNTSNFAPRAIGGSVQNGSPYMVGERGPEMFVPNSQGSIVPNNRMGGGGVVVNQTINVTTGVQQTVRAEIASLMPQIANAAKGAVADAKMRGGNYSKMLGA